MENDKIDTLRILKTRFDFEVNKVKLSHDTTKRYQSWISRYLKYCRSQNIAISNESTLKFLKTYENCKTRRQGFYALQFFTLRVRKQRDFISFDETSPEAKEKFGFFANFINRKSS